MKIKEKMKKGITVFKDSFCKFASYSKYQFRPKTIRRRFKRLHPKHVWKTLRGIHYFHYILIIAVLGSVTLSFLHYRLAIERALQTAVDLADSLIVYVKIMLSPTMELPEGVVPKITKIPNIDIQSVLPFDLVELQRRLYDMWGCIFKEVYFVTYTKWIINKTYYFLFYGLTVGELLFMLWIIFQRFLFDERTDHGKDTRALKWWKKGPEKVYKAVKAWVLSFYRFFTESRYKPILKTIWLLNFNLIAIVAELIAFYFYFVATFEFSSVSIQFTRIFIDALIMFFTTPFPVWLVIAWILFDRFRRKIGYQVLRANEGENCDFLKKLPVVSMILGTMGTGKTTALTDMGLSQQNVFREKAKDLLFQADLKFPNFPWQRFEDALQGAIKHHKRSYAVQKMCEDEETYRDTLDEIGIDGLLYWEKKRDKGIWSLSSCRSFVARVKARYEADPRPHNLFGYDLTQNASEHHDGLIVSDLFEILEGYAQIYYLYSVKSPLLVANYSVRSDATLEDVGNFPEWNMDFFERDTREAAEHSQNAHIVDFDTLRLGNLVDPENPNKGSFEFGIGLLSEIGKERGNKVENSGKKKSDETANALNDGFNARLKMSRHAAVIANYPFIKIFTDEQRAESWGADARDLCKLINIKERSDTKIAMPFFSLEGLIYEFVYPSFKDFYYQLRFTRGDNTLTGYLVKNSFCLFYNHYTKIVNTFGYCVLTLDLMDGTTDGDGEGEKYEYYLSHKKIYSNRFSTDCYADLFAAASLRASVGLDDYPQYETTRATWDEMELQNSYFVRDMAKQFKDDPKNHQR